MKFICYLNLLAFLVSFASNFHGAVGHRIFNGTLRKLHQQATNLSGAAELAVYITSPPAGFLYQLTGNKTSLDSVNITGRAHVGIGRSPNHGGQKAPSTVTYIYIIDSSESTLDYDGPCGTVLQCVQDFFSQFHKEAAQHGAGKFAGVIDFDSHATVTAGLQSPFNPAIERAIRRGSSDGGTSCSNALNAATTMVNDPMNTAEKTIVLFAGDGLCNDYTTEFDSALEDLSDTGATVHSIAIGDNVDCKQSKNSTLISSNHLSEIPKNGGRCFSVRDAHALPDIIDDLTMPGTIVNTIGTTLLDLELQVDGGGYVNIDDIHGSEDLPVNGAVTISFSFPFSGALDVGYHKICVRATGNDTLGANATIEDCHTISVSSQLATSPSAPQPNSPFMPQSYGTAKMVEDGGSAGGMSWWVIFLIASSCIIVAGLGIRLWRKRSNARKQAEVSSVVADLGFPDEENKQAASTENDDNLPHFD